MKVLPFCFSIALFCTSFAAQSKASTLLAEYTFTGTTRTVPSNVDPRLTASNITSASTTITNTSATVFNLFYLLQPGSGPALSQNQTDAKASVAYNSFTLTPLNDHELNLGSITFDIGIQGPQYKFNAYAFVVFTVAGVEYVKTASIYNPSTGTTDPYFIGAGGSPADSTPGKGTIDLSGVPLITEATTFKFYAYYDSLSRTSGSGSFPGGTAYSVRFDNLAINAIPEPSSLVFVAVAAGGALVLRRKGKVSKA